MKETLGIGTSETSESSSTTADSGSKAKDAHKSTSGEDKQQQSGPQDASQTLFSKVKAGVSSVFPKFSLFSTKFKDTKFVDLAKKGFYIVKDELSSNPSKRKRIEYEASPAPSRTNVERSTVTDITVVPTKQSRLSKKWESLKEKMRGHPMFKRVSGLSEPVVNKSQEIAEDMRERWHTSDHPVVNKIQDLNDSVFGENDSAMSFKEIRRRDPSFSLPEFASEVQEVVKPVLNAYFKGDTEVLKKYCSSELINQCKREHNGNESLGIFLENKILHISDVEVRETKMMGETPLIIVQFHTQEVHCVRDRLGAITEGSQDTIHTVHYLWAMAQVDVEELGEGALFPIWRLRDMQRLGIRALI